MPKIRTQSDRVPCGKRAVVAVMMMLAGPGVAVAQNGAAQTKTFVSPGAPVISADSPAARNPAINPSAAGLSQGRMAGPSAGSASVEQRTASRGEITEAQARRWLRDYGYSDITDLYVNRSGRWQAQAAHNGRRVKVVLDHHGTATEQK